MSNNKTETGILNIIFGSAYPVLVLVLLNRARVRQYYAAVQDEKAGNTGGAGL